MASIGPVTLTITDQPPSNVFVLVSNLLSATHDDGPHEQAYREVVELIGIDTLAGEDQVDDIISLDPPFWDGIVRFSTSEVAFQQIHERTLPAQALDEDPDTFFLRADEIRARVTLIPLPPDAPSRDSNLVVRGGVVGQTT
jgi:hypothetical protein